MREETLDGQTAGLIATIANGLSRYIPKDRIEDLLGPNGDKKIGLLLLPIVHDDYLFLLSAQTYWQEYQGNHDLIRTRWFNGSEVKSPTMRHILREAVDRKLAPHDEEAARHLCQLLQDTEVPHGSGFQIWGVFPFVRDGMITAFTTGAISITEMRPDLDHHNEQLYNGTYFFKEAHIDRSNCFQC